MEANLRPRTIICDKNLVIRFGLNVMIESHADVVGDTHNGTVAVKLAKILHPDLILLDVDLDELSGLELIKTLRFEVPNSKLLVVTNAHNCSRFFYQFKRRGVSGICLKSSGPVILHAAINHLGHEDFFADPIILRFIKQKNTLDVSHGFTDENIEILIRMELGNRETSDELDMNLRDVENEVVDVLEKLDVRKRIHAVSKATELGLTILPFSIPGLNESGKDEKSEAQRHALEAIATWVDSRTTDFGPANYEQ
jgi:DNA-binding NarL/FixJ family response regulator